MRRFGEWLRGLWPRRRLRSWRYVSPRRHGAGALLLLALVTALYAYWYLTNDRHIRQQARQYLCDLTGGDWRIRQARFSLFGDIVLTDVELRMPGQDYPFFRAPEVRLRHNSWGLLSRQKLEVREVYCPGSEVALAYDVPKRGYIYPRLHFAGLGAGALDGKNADAIWPQLVAPHVRVLFRYEDAGLALEEMKPIEARTDIRGHGRDCIYHLALTSGEADSNLAIRGPIDIHALTGEVSTEGLCVPDLALLQQLRELKKLGIRGKVSVAGRWDPASATGFIDANLSEGAMVLPPEYGGLRLHHVRGVLSLDSNGVSVRDLSGQIAQAGDARFTVNGRYAGFDANGAFDLRVGLAGVQLPRKLDANGRIADLLAYVHGHYQIDGRLNAAVRLARDGEGRLKVDGNADGADLTLMDRSFPYEMRHGRIDAVFTDRWLEFRGIRGDHGPARLAIMGRVNFPPEGKTYELNVSAEGMPLDDEIKSALWPPHRMMWDLLSPQGKLDARVRMHVDRPGEPEKQDVTLLLRGEASVEYSGFPYRLPNVFGEVALAGSDIAIQAITCMTKEMDCTIDGSIHLDANFAGEANLAITARLPLDAKLARALGEDGNAVFAALRPSGTARIFPARVWRKPGEPIQYRITATVEGGRLQFDQFPYEITEANGVLLFEPNRVTIEGLSGRHKDTPIALRGTVDYGLGKAADVSADLHVTARGVRADQDLFDASPSAVQRVWKQVSPSGLADLEMDLRWKDLDDPNALDYECRILAREMQLRFAGFPYPIRGLTGEVVVTPDRIELKDVKASSGTMRLEAGGTVSPGEKGERVRLFLKARDVPLDSDLLAAFPLETVPFFKRLKPGGSLAIDLPRLDLTFAEPLTRVARAATAATAAARGPASAVAASGAASRPGGAPAIADWTIEGEVWLKEADIDLGTPAKLTGGMVGRLTQKGGAVAIDANLFLGNLSINQRMMTDLSGRMTKQAAGNLVHLDDILGKAYGGRLAGFAEIRLGEPLQYGLRVFGENMDLSEVVNASTEPNQRTVVEGLLDATIEMKVTEGNAPQRIISGLIHLTKGKTPKVPVLVDQMRPVMLALPGDSFSEGTIEYTLKEDKVLFREIHLKGPAMSIVGSGTMNLKNEALRLTFIGRPGIVPRMDSLADELIGGLLRELVEIQVTGTLKKPKFNTIPLRSVEAAIRRLTQPEAD